LSLIPTCSDAPPSAFPPRGRTNTSQAGERVSHPARGATGDRALSADGLTVIAEGLAQTAPFATHSWTEADGRHYVRLLGTELYDAWLIAWSPGSTLGLHDHGASVGAVVVAAGRLAEIFSDRRTRSPLCTRTVSAGRGFTVPAFRVHAVSNGGVDQALSVHVYSPPLHGMTFHDWNPDPSGRSARTLQPGTAPEPPEPLAGTKREGPAPADERPPWRRPQPLWYP